VQDVEQASLAADAGLSKYMVIQRVNRTPVASLEEFERLVNALKPGDPVVMHVSRYNGERITQSILQFTFQ
jgi:S1-C subfamily serine protease